MSEQHEAYSYRVTFNAMHNIVIDNPAKMHAHTFRVGMYAIKRQNKQSDFLNNEKLLQAYFSQYRGIRLNELHRFRDIVPTLENMAEVFYEDLQELFFENGMELLTLDMGDSPIYTYSIGKRILLGSMYNLNREDEIEAYCKRVRKRYEQRAEAEKNGQ